MEFFFKFVTRRGKHLKLGFSVSPSANQRKLELLSGLGGVLVMCVFVHYKATCAVGLMFVSSKPVTVHPKICNPVFLSFLHPHARDLDILDNR
jgi:hypothetical protein